MYVFIEDDPFCIKGSIRIIFGSSFRLDQSSQQVALEIMKVRKSLNEKENLLYFHHSS